MTHSRHPGRAPRAIGFLLATLLLAAPTGARAADLAIGVLDEGSPVWNRPFVFPDNVGSATCSLAAMDFAQNAQHYAVFEIAVSSPENLAVRVVPQGSTIDDSALLVYCDPFAPADPLANLAGYDDDDGEDFLSAITASEGVALAPSHRYFLVLSGSTWQNLGSFTLELQSPTARFVPEPAAAGATLAVLAALGALRTRSAVRAVRGSNC